MKMHYRSRSNRRDLSLLGLATVALASIFGFSASASTPSSPTHPGESVTSQKPTIVLVHGAWADGSSWDKVVNRLQLDGYRVDVPPNPLRGVSYDSAYIADFLHSISGPVVLVGHSYGGMVITNAAVGDSEVKALVYVDAFLPDQGETAFQLAAAQPGSCLSPNAFNIVPFPGAPAGDADTYLKSGPAAPYPGFVACFANDIPVRKAAVLAATQEPAALNAGTDPSGAPAWKTIPTWDFIGTADHVIPPAEQLFMANRAHAHITEVDGSHLSLISHPDAVTQVITEAADTVS
jgi:pimeloyl-ACP methyl ester carboxylesterase